MQKKPYRTIRLIETWDVLKWNEKVVNSSRIVINRNMRCIGISVIDSINQNTDRLIETWDVLK